MCGIVGIVGSNKNSTVSLNELKAMTQAIIHRGPDGSDYYCNGNVGLGFCRLSIIDLDNGMQPICSNYGTVSVCNGEIYNYKEHKKNLEQSDNICFTSNVDTEVIPYLYDKYGPDFVNLLNGQFSIALLDNNKKKLFLYRDHFGIQPLFYTFQSGRFIFSSEIKSILQCENIDKSIDIVGLDQVLSFPGLISPQTMFKNIYSVRPGECISVDLKTLDIQKRIYWDFDVSHPSNEAISEDDYAEGLLEHLKKAINYRLQSDVPVSFYLSGGIDSSLLLSLAKDLHSGMPLHTFSVIFPDDKLIDESKHQELMSRFVNSKHSYFEFDYNCILTKLSDVVYHTECPIKESFDTAALMLSEHVNENQFKVVIGGQGADELFGGYPSYKFDVIRNEYSQELTSLEKQIRKKIWGNENIFYEKKHSEFIENKLRLYSSKIKDEYEKHNCLNHYIVNQEKLKERDLFQVRSYLDFKLRLADHLLSDHGDRMLMANSVEGRYPFLDQELVKYASAIPSDLKIKDLTEKYIVKKIAKKYVPDSILNREKFGFTAPGSPYILKKNSEIINDLLSYDRIKRQGIFNPKHVQDLKQRYLSPGFRINVPYEDDYLMLVITTGMFLDAFSIQGI